MIATFALHSDGKVPDVQVEKAEKWLRVRSKSDERALRALPGKAAGFAKATGQLARGQGLLRRSLYLGERHPTTAGCRRLIGDELIGL